MRSRSKLIAWFVVVGLWVALPAPASAQEPGGLAEADAESTLADAVELLEGVPGEEPGRDLTPVLAELAGELDALEAPERRAARSILARPDDGDADRYGDGFSAPEAADSPLCDPRFCVHWVDAGADAPPLADSNGNDDGDGTPDYVEEVLESADRSRDIQNAALGWTEPIGDGARGGGSGLTDIYLLETDGAYFGYASPDENQGSVAEKQAYMVLDDDMREFDAPPAFTALEAMRVTMAHEYNHVLQFAYDSLQDLWMFESTATWAEEQVYPGIDDYLGYVPAFAASSTSPLTGNDPGSGLKIYGAAVWNHYLSAVHGDGSVRDSWAFSDQVFPAHRAVAAYDAGIGGTGASPFDALGDEFVPFASSTAEWRALPSLYPDADELPGVARIGKLAPGARRTLTLDHLSYGLLNVGRGAAERPLKLGVRAPDGTKFGIDLVARTGSATDGDVAGAPVVDDDGGRAAAVLPGGSYDRVTALVANADPRLSLGGYSRDDERFTVRLIRP